MAMFRVPIYLSILLGACAAPSQDPHVVHPKLGETLASVPGPLPDFGPFATSPVQDDPSKRRCDLPAQVADGRQLEATMAYLVMLHNHAAGESLSLNDLYAIADMARIHGITTRFRGQQTSMSIVAFIGKERGGQPECAGFYHYVPARSDEILRYTVDNERLTKKAVARVAWSDEGNPRILPIEERP